MRISFPVPRLALLLAGVTTALFVADARRGNLPEPGLPLAAGTTCAPPPSTLERPPAVLASCTASGPACGVVSISELEIAKAPRPRAGLTQTSCRARVAPFSAAPPVTPLCREPPQWTIGLRPLDVHVDEPRRLEGWLRYFSETKAGRGAVATWLRRSGKYRNQVEQALKGQKLPRAVVALVFVESGFSPRAVSSAGAVGLWQLMEATAKDLGLEVRPGYDERLSIERSTEAATRHLSDLYAQFGSWELAFAAYDLGAKRLLQRMQSTGAMSFWELADMGALPEETAQYVPKLLAFATILKNLDRFGFDDVQMDRPISTSDLSSPGGVSFGLLARAAGTSIARIRELNPELVKNFVPDIGGWVTVHVPASGLTRARAMFPALLARGKEPGIEDLVPDDFDWSKHATPPSIASLAKPSAACGADPLSGNAVAERAKRPTARPPIKRSLSKRSS
ncbi:MAG: lytic transglycosylase domain-containing protein [Polyangiales bacterium]